MAVFVEDFVGADDRRVIRETNRPKEDVVDSVAAPRRRSVVRFERKFGRNDREWSEIRGRETVGDDVFLAFTFYSRRRTSPSTGGR